MISFLLSAAVTLPFPVDSSLVMNTLTHEGREIAYRHTYPEADGPTTLYVHGSGGTHQLWVNQYASTGPAHPAVALDLSGHGQSDDIETSPGPETMAAYAADVRAVAQKTDAEVLVGNSLGGAVVLTAVLDGFYEPAAVVLAGTGAKLTVHESIRSLLDDDFEAVVSLLHDESLLFSSGDEEVIAASQRALRETGQRVTRRDFLTCHAFDVRDRLAELQVPSLALVGADDGLTPPSYHEYLAAELPNCKLTLLEEAGHLAMAERPDRFNEAIESFLSEQFE